MRKRSFLLLLATIPAWAQGPLSLKDAVALALAKNKALQAAHAGAKASETRITQARSGYLPKLNYAESWARSNNPVFVFSSLLTQHQFGPQNFAIGPLNRPDALNNFQSLVTADQVIYDAGQTKNALRSAELTHDISGENSRKTRMDVIAGVVRTYYGAVLSAENLRAAEESVRSAEADLKRAETVRAAGMATDVDVLSIQVHLAAVKEEQIQRAADLDVAHAALNDVLGLPLETPHDLITPLAPAVYPRVDLAAYEQTAAKERPEARQSKLAENLARTQLATAKGSLLPEVGFRTAFEADRQRFIDRGGANWLAAVTMKWNIFNGFADKSRIQEADFALTRAQAEQQQTDSGVKLQVRRAYADLRAAEQRIDVAKATTAMAEESLRITQNRYSAGLANVTDLLRNETALLQARTRYSAAVYDQRVAATMLELAAGTLDETKLGA